MGASSHPYHPPWCWQWQRSSILGNKLLAIALDAEVHLAQES